jgi:hypothetical protein
MLGVLGFERGLQHLTRSLPRQRFEQIPPLSLVENVKS